MSMRYIAVLFVGLLVPVAAEAGAITVGTASSEAGSIILEGATSGSFTFSVPSVAGTSTGMVLPANGGTNGFVLTTNGATPAVTTWATPTASASSITPGTTTVVGSTAPCIIENTTSTTMGCTAISVASGITSTIAAGTSALGTGAITSATCATVVTTSAPNTATTDVVLASFNGDPTAVTGYIPATAGMLTIVSYPTSGNVNFKVCNNTSGSITPGAITLNWRVVR